MRPTKLLLSFAFALVPFAGFTANAQSLSTPSIYCEECRDLNEHPEDAANFALNQVWGPTQWLDQDQSSGFGVTDPFGNNFTVDINADMSVVWVPIPGPRIFIGAIPFPERLILQVLVFNERQMQVLQLRLDPNTRDFPLPVGDPDPTDDASPTDSNNNDEEDYESEDEDEYDFGDYGD